jgi:hypothetical protein
MTVKRKVLLYGFISAIGLLFSCFTPNPLIPDICTSRGYGIVFPTYISW